MALDYMVLDFRVLGNMELDSGEMNSDELNSAIGAGKGFGSTETNYVYLTVVV